MSFWNKVKSFFSSRKKKRRTIGTSIQNVSKPKQTKTFHSSKSGSSGRSSSERTARKAVTKAVGYQPSKRVKTAATKQTKAQKEIAKKIISVADVMSAPSKPAVKPSKPAVKAEKNSGLTDREKALKRRVDIATHAITNRVGKDFAKDVKSGIYTTKATDKEKKNVAKSIERDYNKKAKSKTKSAIAGITKSDANVRIATKAITGKKINTKKVTKSKAYKAGDIAQEVASYAIAPTGAVEKGLAKAGAKALAKKTLKKQGKELTSKAIKKATKTATKQLAKNKGRTFARKRAADVIANAPFNAKYAASRASEDGEFDKKKFAKDLASNTALDVGIGSGIDAIAGRKGRALAREAKLSKSLNKRLQKIDKKTKNRLASKATENKTVTTAKKGKKAVNKTEANIGEAVQKEFAGIDRRRELGKISKGEAKRQKKALAKVVEKESGKRGVIVRTADGFKRQRVTDKGLEDITDSYVDRLTFDKRFRGNAKSIGKKRIRERIAEQPKGVSVSGKKIATDFGLSKKTKRQVSSNFRSRANSAENAAKERADAIAKAKQESKESVIGTTQRKKGKSPDKAKRYFTNRAEEGKQVKKIHSFKGEIPKEYDPLFKRLKGAKNTEFAKAARKYADDIDAQVAKGEISSRQGKLRKEEISNALERSKVEVDRRVKAKAKRLVEKEEKVVGEAPKTEEYIPTDTELYDEYDSAVAKLKTTKDEAERAKLKKQIKELEGDIYAVEMGDKPRARTRVVEETAEPKAKAKDTAQEPQSTLTAKKTTKSGNESVDVKNTPENVSKRFEDIEDAFTEIEREGKASEDKAVDTLKKNIELEKAEAKQAGALSEGKTTVEGTDDPLMYAVREATERKGIKKPGEFEEHPELTKYFDEKNARAKEVDEAEGVLYDRTKENAKRYEKEEQAAKTQETVDAIEQKIRGKEIPKGEPKPVAKATETAPKGGDSDVMKHISKTPLESGTAKGNSIATDALRKLVNSMGFSERAAKKFAKDNGDEAFEKTFRGNVNNLRQSVQRALYSIEDEQIDFNGNEVGESLRKIMGDVKGKGESHYNDTQSYLYLLNHADRLDSATDKRMGTLIDKYKKIEAEAEKYGYTAERTSQLEKLSEQMDTLENEGITGLDPSGANKRIFDNLTAEEARAKAAEILKNNPAVEEDANRIIGYFRNDLRSQVQAGLISEDTFRHYIKTYPNYVPAHRVPFDNSGFSGNPITINPNSLVAKGSGRDLLPIEEQMKMSTEYTFTRGAQNEVSKQIAEMGGYNPKLLDIYDEADKVNALDLSVHYDLNEGTLQYWDNGQMRSVRVNKEFLKDLKDMQISAPQGEMLAAIASGLGKGNRVFKALITSYNPAFMVKNMFRDVPEGAFQSQSTTEYLKNFFSGKAAASILTNDEWYKAYKRMGGQHSQFINSAEDLFKDENWFKKKLLDRIETLNEFGEQMPRVAEFRSFLEKRGKTPATATADEMRQASEAAADVTVNFGRSGSIGRIINSSIVPFFNPAMQGWSKVLRTITADPTASGFLKLASKGALLGVAPATINELLLADNENYQILNDRDKAVNYYIPLPAKLVLGGKANGTKDGEVFLKIPKARFLSVLGMGSQKALAKAGKGSTDIPYAEIFAISRSQIAPVGWENNIFQQFKNSRIMDEDNAGETWYGTPIENQGDKRKEAKDRYDENTSSIAIELGKRLNKSPKKIDYLLDSYTGVLGDIALPATSRATGRGVVSDHAVLNAGTAFLTKNFTTDSVSQNKLSGKMYERINDLTKKQGSGDKSEKTDYGLWYLDKRSAKTQEIREKIKEIQNSSKSDKQKAKEIRPLQRKMNKINKNGLETEDSFVKAGKKYVNRLKNANISDKTKKTYGLENAMIATAKDRGDDPWELVKDYTKQSKYRPKYAKYAKDAGLSPVEYKEFYNLKEYDADGNKYASKKETIAYLNSRDDLTAQQKAVLYAGLGGWFAKGVNPYGSLTDNSGTKTASSGGGRRRSYGRRRSGRSGGRRKTSSGKAIGYSSTAIPNKSAKNVKSTKTVSVADVMGKSGSKATATALASIIRKSTGADYEAAAKSVKNKKFKNIYKLG